MHRCNQVALLFGSKDSRDKAVNSLCVDGTLEQHWLSLQVLFSVYCFVSNDLMKCSELFMLHWWHAWGSVQLVVPWRHMSQLVYSTVDCVVFSMSQWVPTVDCVTLSGACCCCYTLSVAEWSGQWLESVCSVHSTLCLCVFARIGTTKKGIGPAYSCKVNCPLIVLR